MLREDRDNQLSNPAFNIHGHKEDVIVDILLERRQIHDIWKPELWLAHDGVGVLGEMENEEKVGW